MYLGLEIVILVVLSPGVACIQHGEREHVTCNNREQNLLYIRRVAGGLRAETSNESICMWT